MSRVSKGTRIEYLARKRLEGYGYEVERKNRTRFHSPDFFGVFDLMGLGEDVVFVQVKSRANHFYTARKELREWVKGRRIENVRYQIWLYKGKGEWQEEEL